MKVNNLGGLFRTESFDEYSHVCSFKLVIDYVEHFKLKSLGYKTFN